MNDKNLIRLTLAGCLLISIAWLAGTAATASTTAKLTTYQQQAQLDRDNRTAVAPPRPNGPIVATGQKSPGPHVNTKALYAFNREGELYYYNERIGIGDVDPSPMGNMTVLIPPQKRMAPSECPGRLRCSRQYIERVNLTTGERETLFSHMTSKHRATNWHDVDRVGQHQFAIASIAHDRVWIVNATTGTTEWAWSAQSEFNLTTTGGPFPGDWTHLNDVDILPDGRYMLSLRNQDRVVFVDPQTGLQENWTLGCEDCFSILHEQHNPDYISASRGGPAVLVADSENNRIVEYQRVNGSWQQSWIWQDSQISWPRDADRLPNGNTLIADSHGNRIIEVAPNGSIVWQTTVGNPYNVEHLGTPDGSGGGPSAMRANLTNRTADGRPRYINSSRTLSAGWFRIQWTKLQFILPNWMSPLELMFAMVATLIIGVWIAAELGWRGWSVRWPVDRQCD